MWVLRICWRLLIIDSQSSIAKRYLETSSLTQSLLSQKMGNPLLCFSFYLAGLPGFSFYSDIQSFSNLHGSIAFFVGFESFVAKRLFYVLLPLILFPLAYLFSRTNRPAWARPYLDFLGIYVIFRLVIQLIGLNVLVFDSVTSRFLLISQVLFFLPYSLLIWGWLYWRLDTIARGRNRPLFRLDCEGVAPPRPIDYFVA